MFTGRVVGSGEPLFLQEDTDLAIALAEEEADTCPSCGLLKVWCRDPGNQFAFEAHDEQCQVTYTTAAYQARMYEQRDEATRRAAQVSARFREGHEPDLTAGLDLPEEDVEQDREQPDG